MDNHVLFLQLIYSYLFCKNVSFNSSIRLLLNQSLVSPPCLTWTHFLTQINSMVQSLSCRFPQLWSPLLPSMFCLVKQQLWSQLPCSLYIAECPWRKLHNWADGLYVKFMTMLNNTQDCYISQVCLFSSLFSERIFKNFSSDILQLLSPFLKPLEENSFIFPSPHL